MNKFINFNEYEHYNKKLEKKFMFDNIDCVTKNEYKINELCREMCVRLRGKEYLLYSSNNFENKTTIIQNIIKNTDLKEELSIINACYCYLMQFEFSESLMGFYPIFYELHDRLVFYYRAMNEKIYFKKYDMKIINVNKHNHCVNYVLKNFKTSELPSVLFFDSHPDMNTPMKLSIDSDNDSADIGSVNIPIFSKYKKNNGLFWIVPESHCWSHAKRTIGIDKNLEMINLNDVEIIKEKLDNYNNIIFHIDFKQKVDKNINIDDLIKVEYNLTDINSFNFFNNITNNYILNIDLDYFISYGRITSDDILNNNFDEHEHDQITSNLEEIDFDASHSNISLYPKTVNKLNNEIKSIRQQIDKFLIFINKLKEEGKIPKMIILCDSSRVTFSLIDSSSGSGDYYGNRGREITNSYLPKRYSFWLRNTLIEQIKLLFNEEYEIL